MSNNRSVSSNQWWPCQLSPPAPLLPGHALLCGLHQASWPAPPAECHLPRGPGPAGGGAECPATALQCLHRLARVMGRGTGPNSIFLMPDSLGANALKWGNLVISYINTQRSSSHDEAKIQKEKGHQAGFHTDMWVWGSWTQYHRVTAVRHGQEMETCSPGTCNFCVVFCFCSWSDSWEISRRQPVSVDVMAINTTSGHLFVVVS